MVSGDLVDTWSQLTLLTTAGTVSFESANSITRRKPLWSLSDHEETEAQRRDVTHSNTTREEVELNP